MRKNNVSSWIFGALGMVLAVAVVLICITQRSAEPKLFGQVTGAEECAQAMMDRICQGDYAGACAYLYGNPNLGADTGRQTPAAQMLWDAFVSSLECRSQGSCYATVSGVAQDFVVSGLDIPGLTRNLKEFTPAVLDARVEAAEDMSQVYDENHEYREDFAQSVLEEAVQTVIESSARVEHSVTLHLVYEQNQWWVVPDEALLTAISGGIL